MSNIKVFCPFLIVFVGKRAGGAKFESLTCGAGKMAQPLKARLTTKYVRVSDM